VINVNFPDGEFKQLLIYYILNIIRLDNTRSCSQFTLLIYGER